MSVKINDLSFLSDKITIYSPLFYNGSADILIDPCIEYNYICETAPSDDCEFVLNHDEYCINGSYARLLGVMRLPVFTIEITFEVVESYYSERCLSPPVFLGLESS